MAVEHYYGEELYVLLKKILQGITTGAQSASVDGTTVTFTMLDGSTQTMLYPPLVDGTTITEFDIENGKLHLEQDDGTEFDAYVPGSNILNTIDATCTVGGVDEGTHYNVGTEIEQILREILQGAQPPIATAKYNSITKFLRDATLTSDNLNSVDMYTKGEWGGANLIDTLKGVLTWEPKAGDPVNPTFSETLVDLTFSPSKESHEIISTNKLLVPPLGGEAGTLKWKVTVTDDGGLSGVDTATIEWIYPKYWGMYAKEGSVTEAMVDALTLETITSDQIKNFTKVLEKGKAYNKTGIVSDYAKIVYAYPAVYGTLVSVKDKNSFDCTSTYSVATKQIDGVDYYVYLLLDGAGFNNATQTYS